MSLYTLHMAPALEDPILVIGLSGWGDAASAASDAADWLADGGQPVVTFDPDSVFDYRSNRPILRYSAGEPQSIAWPRLEITHVQPSGRDVLVLSGSEPDLAWSALSEALGDLAQSFGVAHVVALGAMPTPVRHGKDTTIISTTSDPRLMLPGDDLLMDEIVVPSSAVSVFRSAIEGVGIESIGYWAQVPQYVGRPYHPAALGLLKKVAGQVASDFDLTEVEEDAEKQLDRLDEIIRNRSDAAEFVSGLGDRFGNTSKIPDVLPTAEEIADEVERFLEASDEG